jgi:excinuclease ABC subunit C
MKKKPDVSGIPDAPGVYLMKGEREKIIYVGKAANLRSRVSSYFANDTSHTPRIARMVTKILKIDFIVTENEIDALILEANLIKLHKPPYNIKFRDDKKYPFIKATIREEFPRVFPTRIIKKDGSLYLGPFTDMKAVKHAIKAGRRIFPVRSCGAKLPKKDCLDFHLGLCAAPCISNISPEDYQLSFRNFLRFLDGKQAEIEKDLEDRMESCSKQLKFEKAKELRDRLFALRKVQNRQKMVLGEQVDIDIIALSRAGDDFSIVVDEVREGKLIFQHNYFLNGINEQDEAMETFITSYYAQRFALPQEVIVSSLPRNRKLLEQWLSKKAEKKLRILHRVKKEKLALLSMATKNAQFYLQQLIAKKMKKKVAKEVLELQNRLKLKAPPQRIEAFDISNIMGEHAVGSSVLFVNGKPRKSGYLHYRIRDTKGINDVAMMKEVISRKLNRIIKNKDEKPDLILVDGGEGQLNAALSILKKMGMDIPVMGLAKRFEELHLPGKKVISLPGDSSALKLLKRIRDESHRFAIQYYRKLHKRALRKSMLDDIPGLGEVKKMALMKRFGSVDRLKRASLDDIAQVQGFGKKTAHRLWMYLQKPT